MVPVIDLYFTDMIITKIVNQRESNDLKWFMFLSL